MFLRYLIADPLTYGLVAVLIMFSICCHEYAHAWMALREGDDTAAREGHLSLNPMIQMGWMSIIMLLIIGIAWGAVPVRRDRMRHPWSDALVSFAGPAMNLLLAVVFALLVSLAGYAIKDPKLYETVYNAFFGACSLNVVLAVFNMLPIPGLDGWHILRNFAPKIGRMDAQKQSMLFMAMFALLFLSPAMYYLWTLGDLSGTLMVNSITTVFGMLGLKPLV